MNTLLLDRIRPALTFATLSLRVGMNRKRLDVSAPQTRVPTAKSPARPVISPFAWQMDDSLGKRTARFTNGRRVSQTNGSIHKRLIGFANGRLDSQMGGPLHKGKIGFANGRPIP
jgi:hypothetical protein